MAILRSVQFPTSWIFRFLSLATIAVAVSLAGSIFSLTSSEWKVEGVPIAFWAWRNEAPRQRDVTAAVDKARARTLFLRAGQIDWQDGEIKRIRPVNGPLPAGIELHLVYNATRSLLTKLDQVDENVLATTIVKAFNQDVERARRERVHIAGIQLDIDMPTRLLGRYKKLLAATRKSLEPGIQLSITGLPAWMEASELKTTLKEVNFWIPQLYGSELPGRFDQMVPISSTDDITHFVKQARALEIYLQVVQRFPNTRAARDSMFTVAVCHERLSNYNSYWREIYENGLHAGQRMVTYEDVKATYPGYQLPRGTFGWQPSTRTVNGGPGWAPPPTPPLRLSRKQRLLLMAYQLEDQLKRFFAKHARHWLAEALLLAGVLLTWPVAKRDRKTLLTRFYRLRRRRAATKVTYPWFALFWIDPQEQSRRETFKQTFHENYGLLRDMSQNYRNSHLLIRSFVLDVLLLGSMIALIWMAFFKQY